MTDEQLQDEINGNEISENSNENTDTVLKNASPESREKDYSVIEREDVEALRGEFPELSEMESITELDNPMRYGMLRDLGLSPAEAYLATSKRRRGTDNRNHVASARLSSAYLRKEKGFGADGSEPCKCGNYRS